MTNEQKDIRWEQRFSNYRKALNKFRNAVELIATYNNKANEVSATDRDLFKGLVQLQKEGLIQRFEYTYELSWKVMKDYAEFQGNNAVTGSRDAIREAYKMNLISDAEGWMDMYNSRIATVHTYDEETVEQIYAKIIDKYYSLFMALDKAMLKFLNSPQKGIFDEEK